MKAKNLLGLLPDLTENDIHKIHLWIVNEHKTYAHKDYKQQFVFPLSEEAQPHRNRILLSDANKVLTLFQHFSDSMLRYSHSRYLEAHTPTAEKIKKMDWES